MAEYDIDYIMPYDEDGVWDSEIIIKDSDDISGRVSTNDVLRDVSYLVKDFKDYVSKHNDKIEVTESHDFRNRMTHERVRTHSKYRR
jgi:hypothetical protein